MMVMGGKPQNPQNSFLVHVEDDLEIHYAQSRLSLFDSRSFKVGRILAVVE